jgi:hypothetical protein
LAIPRGNAWPLAMRGGGENSILMEQKQRCADDVRLA